MQEKDFLERIGKRIAHYRKERNMTQMVLSDLTEMEQSALARIESGKANVTALTLLKIARVLKVDPKQFLDFGQ